MSILSSPARCTRNSIGRFSATGEPPAPELCQEMDNEMRKSFIGPMPVKDFFQKFLPTPLKLSKAEKDKLVGFKKMSACRSEAKMYGKFVRFPFIALIVQNF